MKNLFVLMSFSLVFLFGCNKEKPTINAADYLEENGTDVSLYAFKTDAGSPVWKAIPLGETHDHSSCDPTDICNSTSAHAEGDYHAPDQFVAISFSGTQDERLIEGNADFLQELPLGNLHLLMETECVMAAEGEAIYVGVVTEVLESFFPPSFDITGWYFSFRVKDNGQGDNALLDQYYDGLYLSPENLCEIHLDWGNLYNVGEESDKIEVKK